MTDQEFDELLCRVMIDAAKADIEEIEAENIPVSSSRHFQREMRKMLKDPLRWAKAKTRPMWKTVLQRVAIFFVICSLSLGSIMVASPTARAIVVRWVVEWYESHVVFRFSGEQNTTAMPKYKVYALPEGYIEKTDCVTIEQNYVAVIYENPESPELPPIYFDYTFMQEGSAIDFVLIDETAKQITLNGMKGYILPPKELGEMSTVSWIDETRNIQFCLDAVLSETEILAMARSVSTFK